MENVCQTPGQRLGPATRPKTGMSLVQALDDHDNNPAKGWIQTTVCSSHTVAEEMDTWPSPVLSNFPNDQNNDIQDQEQLLITDIPVESEEVVVLEESVPMETTENNLSNVTKPDSPKQKLQTCCSHVSPMEMSSQEQYTDMHKAIDNTTTATASNIENTPHIKRDSLTPFSEQNVQVQGGGELKQDMVYLIQASNGDSITVVWTGQQFKKFGGDLADLSFSSDEQFSGVGPAAGVAEKAAAQPADNSHMTGGGGGNNQARGSTMLRGNPLGLLMQKRHEMQTGKIYTIQSNLRNTERVERTGHDLLPNGRLWNFTQAPTKRRALHPEMEESSVSAKQDSIEIMDDSSVQETKQQKDSPQKSPGTVEKQSTQEDQPQPFKRSAKKDDETFAVCHNCGYLSQNFDQCERCRKKLPQNPKMHRCVPFPKRKVVYQWKKGTPKITVDKKSFYSSQLTDQMGVYKGLKDNEESTIIGGRRVQVVRAYPKRGRTVGSKLSNVRHQKPSEPETVTISSDEDELNASSSKRQQQSADVSHRSETYNSSTSTTQDSQERSPSPIFPVITSHQSVLPTVSRLERMEDKLGNVISQHGRQKMEVDEVEKKDTEANHAEEPEIQGIHVFVRLLRFGTQRINSRVVTFSTDYITFEIQCEDKSVLIRIYPKEITLCEANLTYRMPVLLLYLTHGCGIRIRAALNMNPNPDSVVAFDPNCRDMTRKLIVIILEPAKVNDSVKGKIMQIFSAYKLVHSELGEDKEIFREITPEEANKKLVEAYPEGCSMYNLLSTSHSLLAHHHSPAAAPASPMQTSVSSSPQQQQEPRAEQEQEAKHKQDTEPEQEHQEKELDREPDADSSPPCAGFVGNVENLLTYPPPPATGGITITNEDLYCLNEGEFLNDVIIDFYLKYLVQERLTEEDRKRTHIFSSFFYKRLTQRLSRYNFSDQEAQASPMRKRHTQVKTWTRHVDIFEKDFVIVPINENAHWFLAIICFPGMERPQSIKYIFINKSAGNPASPDDKMAAAAEAGNIKLPGGTTSLPREDFIELFGCKQPCILIFDSLAGPSRSNVVRTLREYLQVEWDTRKKLPKRVFDKDMIKGGVPKVPQQNNYSDCGVYVLQYVESFFETPIKDFSIPIKLPHWFSEDRVNSKRSEIQELICQLKAESDRKFTS